MKNKGIVLVAVLLLICSAIVLTMEIKKRIEQRDFEQEVKAAKFQMQMDSLRAYTDSLEDSRLTEMQKILKSIERKLERDKR